MRKDRRSGYAMLFIFLMAAIVGISLYNAIPSVAFEAQRDKEQLLIDRGEQYTRAIQLFFRKNRTYPAKMEDLDNYSGVRFLRQHYVDPMTGENKWRLIHVGPGGVFLDSLTQKNNNAKKQDSSSVNNFVMELPALGSSGPTTGAVNPGLRRRASDLPGGGGDPNGNADPNAPPPIPADPNAQPPVAVDPNTANLPGGTNPTPLPASLAQPGQTQPGLPGQPGAIPGQPGGNPGADVIRNLLTTPRPGGLNGLQQGGPAPGTAIDPNAPQTQQPSPAPTGIAASNPAQNQTGGQVVGGGIAGVASTAERPGIKLYNKKENYNEWEFIYDFGKESGMNQQLQQQQQQQQQQNQNNTNPNPGATPSNPTPSTGLGK